MFVTLVIALLLLVVAKILPCPDPVAPTNLVGQATQSINMIIYICCGLYAFISAKTFQFWARWLPLGFSTACLFIFIQVGEFRHAYFLAIHLGLSITYVVIFNVIFSVLLSENQVGWLTRIGVAFFLGYLMPMLALANAVEFSKDLC